jgi:hypothetical protein
MPKVREQQTVEQKEEVVKTPFKGDSEEHKLMAMDWVVEKFTKDKLQLSFLGWDHEDEEGFHHFKVIYSVNVVFEEKSPDSMEEEVCTSCSS